MTRPEREPDPERLELDRAMHDVATTRRIAVGAVVVSAALLAGLARTWWAYGIAIVSLIAVRFWVLRVTTSRADERALSGRAIELRAEQLVVPRADGTDVTIARPEIARVEIDHERLLVVVRLHDAREIEIEPTFGGLGLDGLAHRLERWRSRSLAA
ncbi:MAG: hypothetical protein K1X94_11360 [Sandaracinaceae bacterium]|nr:hypothetical protein [Sandaracinaceae bacterium]